MAMHKPCSHHTRLTAQGGPLRRQRQESREFDPGGLGRRSAGHFPIPSVSAHLLPSRLQTGIFQNGEQAQGGLWSGDPALPPSCFLVSLTKSIRWSHSGSTAQGWPSTLRARCSRATDPALEGALRTSMKEITRGELQGVQRKEAPMPEAMAVNKYFRCWANHANPN